MGKYSTDVKRIALEKIFQPGACLTDISDEMQIPRITLYVWMRSAQNGTMRKRNRRTNMTIVEKQALVIEARKLRDEELGLWLREKGLHESSIDAWEREINSVLSMHDQSASSRSDECARIKELEGELRRKDKALAEMSALIVLKKKLEILFGEEEQ